MPYLICTNEECRHRFFEPSRFADQCTECGDPAVPVEEFSEPTADDLVVPGGRSRPEQPHTSHARALARKVLRDHQIAQPPTPVLAIARLQGLRVVEADLGSLSGRLLDDVIEVSITETENAKRFSIAHELGHHFLRTQHDSGPTVEAEANAFAGELLAPGPWLHAALLETTNKRQLRERFRVSEQVIEIAAEQHRVSHKLTD